MKHWNVVFAAGLALAACACSEESPSGETADTTSSSSSSGATGGEQLGCFGNGTAGSAQAFELGSPAVGTVCGDGTSGGYFFFKAEGSFLQEDLFTVHIRLRDVPANDRIVRFGVGSRGTWSQTRWATSTESAGLHASHMEDTLVDIPLAVESDGDTLIYLIAMTTLRSGEPDVSFDYTVTRQ